MNEPGLFDYIIFNDELEEAYQQLVSVAQRALAGQVSRSRLGLYGSPTNPVLIAALSTVQHELVRPHEGWHAQVGNGTGEGPVTLVAEEDATAGVSSHLLYVLLVLHTKVLLT